jgi:competence protein ComEA
MPTLSRASTLFSFGVLIVIFYLLAGNPVLATEKIEINTASSKELQEIKGIGPVLAERIIIMRQTCYFYPLSSLVEVKGIGPAILTKIEQEGKAFALPPQDVKSTTLCQSQIEETNKIVPDITQKIEADSPSPPPASKIDINAATAIELQRLTGVGETFAQRIIEARPFNSLNELEKVNGLGPKTLEKIKEQGLAWVDPQLQPIKKATDLESIATASLTETVNQPKKEKPNHFLISWLALAAMVLSGAVT